MPQNLAYIFSGSASLFALSVFTCDPNRGYSGHILSSIFCYWHNVLEAGVSDLCTFSHCISRVLAPYFFKMLPKFKIAARGQLQFFVNAKTLKFNVRNYSSFTITFPTIWRCAGNFFKVLLKFKMAAADQPEFVCGRENSNNYFGQFFSNVNITFLAAWGCASDFVKMLAKFKMAARGYLHFFCERKNSKTKSQKLFKFYYHIPHEMEMCRRFSRVLRKFKMAAMDKLHTFLRAQKLKNRKQK